MALQQKVNGRNVSLLVYKVLTSKQMSPLANTSAITFTDKKVHKSPVFFFLSSDSALAWKRHLMTVESDRWDRENPLEIWSFRVQQPSIAPPLVPASDHEDMFTTFWQKWFSDAHIALEHRPNEIYRFDEFKHTQFIITPPSSIIAFTFLMQKRWD